MLRFFVLYFTISTQGLDMKKGIKHIEVDEETHLMAKEQSKQAGMTLKAYAKFVFSLMQTKSNEKEK